jgi:hypothetical protein
VKRLCASLLCLLLSAVAGLAVVEMTIARVEEEGRLLVPVRGIFESTGARVEWNPYDRSVDITLGNTFITMWVNSQTAAINGNQVWLDVPPRNVGGRVHIPLRFVGESLGRTVQYQGNVVTLSAPNAEDIILYVQSTRPPRPPLPPQTTGELMPQSNDRNLTAGDLTGWSNWNLTLARNEIYARHGRPFNNDHIRRHFVNTGWYSPNPNFRESWLSPLESRNAAFIADYQKRVFGAPATRP